MNFNFSPFPVLETERLTLRELNLEDAKAIFSLRTSKEVNKFITRNTPKNLSEARAFIDQVSNLIIDSKSVFWGIESKHNNELIGTIGLHNIESANDYAEIGYELNPNYQQKGFMSEALQEVVRFSFKNLELKTIESFTHKDNNASTALLEKYNFVFQTERKDDDFDNNRIYKITNEN